MPGVAALPDSEEMKTRWPRPRSTIAGVRMCASTIGARRLTSSARSICSTLNESSVPEAGSAALATRMSTWPASAARRSTSARLGEVDGQRAGAQLRRERLEHVAAPTRQDQLCAASRQRLAIACPMPPVAPVRRTVEPEICTSCEPIRMKIVALFGPTGVGKTAVAIALAELLRARGRIRSPSPPTRCRSMQGLEILTGAASPAERARLEHRLLSFLPVDATFSVGQYAQLAHAQIDELLAEGRRPIVVGGTGLYLRAALAELDLRPAPEAGVRERLTLELERDGPEALHARLAELAPWAAEGIEPGDRHRVVRALELLELGELEPPEGPSQLWSEELRHPTLLAGLTMEREALYEAIDVRVDGMIAAGAREEVLRASAGRVSETAAKALGFEELLAGDVERMKRRTRNYARAAHLDAQAGRRRGDRRDGARSGRRGGRDPRLRRPMTMTFEKWQALGNDYLIVEPRSFRSSSRRRACAGSARATSACSPTACCCSPPPADRG